jgi:DNA-binding SARP family transcriptional activator
VRRESLRIGSGATAGVRFRVLGPLEVVVDRRPIELGRRKQRALLGILLVDADRVVALDRLVDELWDGQPPSQAIASLQAYVSNLRRLLEPGRARGASPTVLVSQPPGYRLAVAGDDVDARVFETLVTEGHQLLDVGRHADAAAVLTQGLALWRGPLLADFPDAPFAQAERARLEELRLSALEDRISADLALGRHAALVAEVEHLVSCHPFRERLHAQHILALYRSGRQADALRTYQNARRTLQEELGIDPNPTLQKLHDEVLRQSPELDWSPPGCGGVPAGNAAEGRGGDRDSSGHLTIRSRSTGQTGRRPDAQLLPSAGNRCHSPSVTMSTRPSTTTMPDSSSIA